MYDKVKAVKMSNFILLQNVKLVKHLKLRRSKPWIDCYLPISKGEMREESCKTITVLEGTTTETCLTPWRGDKILSTRTTSEVQQSPNTSKYVFSIFCFSPVVSPPLSFTFSLPTSPVSDFINQLKTKEEEKNSKRSLLYVTHVKGRKLRSWQWEFRIRRKKIQSLGLIKEEMHQINWTNEPVIENRRGFLSSGEIIFVLTFFFLEKHQPGTGVFKKARQIFGGFLLLQLKTI